MGANCQQVATALRDCFEAKEAKAEEEDSTRSMTQVLPSVSSPAASKLNPLGKESNDLDKEPNDLDEKAMEPSIWERTILTTLPTMTFATRQPLFNFRCYSSSCCLFIIFLL